MAAPKIKYADEGFAAIVEAEVAGRAAYVIACATEPECRAALRKLYPNDKITRIGLGRLSPPVMKTLKLRLGEVEPW